MTAPTASSANGILTAAQHNAAEFLAGYWKEQRRDKAALALSGGLLRDGWGVPVVEAFLDAVCVAAGDEETARRVAVVKPTAAKLAAGQPATGWPEFARLIGPDGEAVVWEVRVRLGHTINLERLADHKKLPVEHLQSLGLYDLAGGGVGIPYRDGSGRVVEVKTRTALAAKQGSRWPKGKPLLAYGEDRLASAAAAGFLVLVEGESDCWTLWFHGFSALGLPGADTVKKTLALGHVGAVPKVYAVQEPDAGGEDFIAGVRQKLAALGWEGQLMVVKLDGAKDPSELHQQHPDPEEFRERFQAALNTAEPVGVPQPVIPAVVVRAVRLSEVRVLPVEWPWERYIPYGTITLLDGDPGLGKSFISLDVAARLTRGWRMPPEGGSCGRSPCNVLILNAEDDAARTIRPRLEAMGADLDRVFLLNELPDGDQTRPPVLPDDLPVIEQLVSRHQIRLAVFDPLMAFLTGKVDSHKDSDIRRVLHRVKMMAERTQLAVLVVRHLNKLVNVSEPLYRGGGSIGIIGAARSALLVGKHPNDPSLRVLCRSKGNLCEEPPALAYRIERSETGAVLGWVGEVDVTAEALLGKKPTKGKGDALDEAVAFLEEVLAQGPQEADDILHEAEKRGIKERTLRRAKQELEVQSKKVGFGADARTHWHLPGDSGEPGEPPDDAPDQPPSGDPTVDPEATPEAPIDDQGARTPNDLAIYGENPQIPRETAKGGQPQSSGHLCEVGHLWGDRVSGLESGPPSIDGQVPPIDGQTPIDCQVMGTLAAIGQLQGNPQDSAPETPIDGQGVCVRGFRLIRTAAELSSVAEALATADRIGLDTETTGLDPRTDRIRLLSLAVPGTTFLLDCFEVDPRPLFPPPTGRLLVMHNGQFDLSMLAALGFTPGSVRDTLLLSRLLYGTRRAKGFHSLESCAERELGRTLDKKHQRADWSKTLTFEQLAYAAADAEVLLPLYEALDAKVQAAHLGAVAEIESRCLPAVVWLAGAGVLPDVPAWRALAAEADTEAHGIAQRLDALAAPPPEPGMFSGWNWDSPQQVLLAFQAAGCPLESTGDEVLAKVQHPLAELLRDYRSARKRHSTYGPEWLEHVALDGRVYASWNQLGADSGRMACSKPNLQNLPRRADYRRCFMAPPARVLVKADYSQIELRIAAKVSGDPNMLAAYRDGQDLHALTARQVLGVREVTKDQRQLAKALNFGLLYGMGAPRFREYAQTNYGVQLTPGQAAEYREAFFRAYPGLRRWHRSVPDKPVETRTLAGRRRLDVAKFTEKLNTPVQGTGADGLKLALALLWERRDQVPGTFPVLVVHDEIVVECDRDQAEVVAEWLKTAMIDAMRDWLDPVPVEVEVKVAPTWGGE